MRRCSFRVWSCDIAPEQALVRAQRGFDFDVFRQHRDIVHAQAVRRLALGLQEILDAVFGHDARRLLGESAAQILGTLRKLLGHGSPRIAVYRRRSSGSGYLGPS